MILPQVILGDGGDMAAYEDFVARYGRGGENDRFALNFSRDSVCLQDLMQPKVNPLVVDFCAGAVDHRRRFGGGRNQEIARAVGIKKDVMPRVLDLTAGLGRDAFVLVSLGCSVTMNERNPVVHAMLTDALKRLSNSVDAELLALVSRFSLLPCIDSHQFLGGASASEPVDVIYLDPMFPERSKSALVKKDMQFFHEIVGADDDADELFERAMAVDVARVVVKRPRKAPVLADAKPHHSIEGKSLRFDVYVKRKL